MNSQTPRFADRQVEVELLRRTVQDLACGIDVEWSLLELTGAPGIGKTFLLSELKRMCRLPVGSLFFALVDCLKLDLAGDLGPVTSRIGIMESVASQASLSDSRQLLEHLAYCRRLLVGQSSVDGLEKYLEQAVADFTRCLQRQTGFVCLDAVECMSPDLLQWLEAAVVQPLVGSCLLFILSGRQPIRWSRYSTRKATRRLRLDPFTPEDTVAQVKDTCPAVADSIYHLTRGHPQANKVVAKAVMRLATQNGININSKSFHTHIPKILREVEDSIVDRILLLPVPRELRPIFEVLSLPRSFDVGIVQTLLFERTGPQVGLSECTRLVAGMIETGLVRWSTMRRAYVMDAPVRSFLAHRLKCRAPEEYVFLSQKLAATYQRFMKLGHDPIVSLSERLYHLADASVTQQEPIEVLERTLTAEVRWFFDTMRSQGVGVLNTTRVKETLLRDSDLNLLLPGIGAKLAMIMNSVQ